MIKRAFYQKEKGFTIVHYNFENLQGRRHFWWCIKTAHDPLPKGRVSNATQFTTKPNTTPILKHIKPIPSFNNYRTADLGAFWRGNCSIYQAINFHNIYPDIYVRHKSDGKSKCKIAIKSRNLPAQPNLKSFPAVKFILRKQLPLFTTAPGLPLIEKNSCRDKRSFQPGWLLIVGNASVASQAGRVFTNIGYNTYNLNVEECEDTSTWKN